MFLLLGHLLRHYFINIEKVENVPGECNVVDIIQLDENSGFRDEKEISIINSITIKKYFSNGYRIPSLAFRAHFTPV